MRQARKLENQKVLESAITHVYRTTKHVQGIIAQKFKESPDDMTIIRYSEHVPVSKNVKLIINVQLHDDRS